MLNIKKATTYGNQPKYIFFVHEKSKELRNGFIIFVEIFSTMTGQRKTFLLKYSFGSAKT